MYIVLLRKRMSQWFGKGPLRGPGSKGSKGSACLWQVGSEGGGGGFAARVDGAAGPDGPGRQGFCPGPADASRTGSGLPPSGGMKYCGGPA